MTETLLRLVADWGVLAVGLATFLSCLALPVPSSLAMLAGGAFAASGDLSAPAVMASAWAGAVAGDQLGYGLGRLAGPRVEARMRRAPAAARARAWLQDKAMPAVFFSRWLVSPLGPWVNLAAGAGGVSWRLFTPPAVAGEAVWVALYTGLGLAFGSQIEALAGLTGNLSGALAALALAAGLWLLSTRRRRG